MNVWVLKAILGPPDSEHVCRLIVPENAKVLQFGVQGGDIVAWFTAPTKVTKTAIPFWVTHTGMTIDTEGLEHVQTLDVNGTVWHIFKAAA
jgi:hypothetical protein